MPSDPTTSDAGVPPLDRLRLALSAGAVPDAPGPTARDQGLVAVASIAAVIEAIARPDVPWRVVSIVIAIVVIASLPWRRTHPLPVTALGFGLTGAVSLVFVITEGPREISFGLFSTAVIVVVPYALARWGSGRHVAIGLGMCLVTWALGSFADDATVGDAIGGLLFLLFPACLGALVRARHAARTEQLLRLRLAEREDLARELHDTVAHHLSAVAVQAQAGRTLATTRPDAAVEALVVIEEAASRSLDDLRRMVRSLRAADDAPLRPAAGLRELTSVVEALPSHVDTEVRLDGPVHAVPDSVGGAVHRIVQEAVTNVIRHGDRVSTIRIGVDVQAPTTRSVPGLAPHLAAVGGPRVVVSVVDDGRGTPNAASPGYGLVGMRERAQLLGGALTAGPEPTGGWAVRCVFPIGADR